ncbi:glycoside hydrolase family 3 N-terminal domain-containing protein [Glaciihabitans sp. dw_435]|uniref:beta-xylosidase/alpha-l-arabinosidase n=1 Tax=Glaciihabitans sp. dw_435 TaxID=2720081 RepID=UPI0027DAD65D|nr:glycoside hydrolase family 3 N-terminal domain-containing protein [Glaciihabitans sp. dw_435]
MTTSPTSLTGVWNDPTASTPDRVEALVEAMTLDEKIAQLYGVWVGAATDGGEVAPHQHDMEEVIDLDELLPRGLGQLTRPFGSAPVDPALGALSLMRTQQRIVGANRFAIPAIAHEECLAGFAAWGATAYPVPLSWGATFNPELVQKMAGRIGADMRSVGVHQGLAPVLDVVRDARWGRVEETIGEDPYLVGTVATAYVKGLEQAGIVATLKHFVGYSASKAGRNLAPVSVGSRERADVLLAPFEMAVRESGVRSVMHAYSDIDGVPSAADRELLTGLLRDTWGFAGTVVADYFGVAFLRTLHGIAGDWADAAVAALTAGVDVELPTVKTFGAPLLEAIADGRLDESVVDTALRRVLTQKIELGLLDPDWSAVPAVLRGSDTGTAVASEALRGTVSLDDEANRAIARELAEHAIVLLTNTGILPLAGTPSIALIGPNADDPMAVLGCYSFPAHVGVQHPELPIGLSLPTLADSVRAEFPDSEITLTRGTTIDGFETDGIADAVRAAEAAGVAIVVLGDRAGLFGRGTSGEGCDADSLRLPGTQQELLDAVLATGTPTIVVLLSGRPYALGRAITEAAAIVQSFFPGEEGTPALAGVLSGRVNPSGRLPVSVPAHAGSQPSTYLAGPLGHKSGVSNVDPTAAFAFGHGIGFTTFAWSDSELGTTEIATDGHAQLTVTVTNTGDRSGVEVVQLYLHDPVASVVRPVQRLVGYHRIELAPGEQARLSVSVPADLSAFSSRTGDRVVEPGELVLGLGTSSSDIRFPHSVALTGDTRVVDHTRELHATWTAQVGRADR